MWTAVRGVIAVRSNASGGERYGVCFVGPDFVADETTLLNSRGSDPSLDLFRFGSYSCCLDGHSCLGNCLAYISQTGSDGCRATARFFRTEDSGCGRCVAYLVG